MADRLTDDTTRHWTRREHPLVSLIRIDGQAYRLMGTEPKDVPAMKQVGVQVLPTRTIYDFDDGHVHVTLTFLTPALPDRPGRAGAPADLPDVGRPLGRRRAHAVSIYDSTSALLAVNTPDQKVEWARAAIGDLTVLRVGTVDQTLLAAGRRRYAHRLGLCLCRRPGRAGPGGDRLERVAPRSLRQSGRPSRPATTAACPARPTISRRAWRLRFELGRVGAEPVSRHLMIAYDEIYAHKFLGRKLRPYWRRDGATPDDLLRSAERDYAGSRAAMRGV